MKTNSLMMKVYKLKGLDYYVVTFSKRAAVNLCLLESIGVTEGDIQETNIKLNHLANGKVFRSKEAMASYTCIFKVSNKTPLAVGSSKDDYEVYDLRLLNPLLVDIIKEWYPSNTFAPMIFDINVIKLLVTNRKPLLEVVITY